MKWKLSTDHAVGSPVVPKDRQGVIKGTVAARKPRIGGDMTNAEYAKENGITKRMASKKRRGY